MEMEMINTRIKSLILLLIVIKLLCFSTKRDCRVIQNTRQRLKNSSQLTQIND